MFVSVAKSEVFAALLSNVLNVSEVATGDKGDLLVVS
jgi:hypothetical protein